MLYNKINCNSKVGIMMRINWIEFENLETGLKCNRIDFNSDITLLVGISGAGKTIILNAIKKSLAYAIGSKSNGKLENTSFSATLNFSVEDKTYEWSYTIQKDESNISFENISFENNSYIFTKESLVCNGKNIISRDSNKIVLANYDKFPKPKNTETLLFQYSNDENFKDIVADIKKIYPFDMDMDIRVALEKESFIDFKSKMKEHYEKNSNKINFEEISHLPTICKLYITKKYDYDQTYMHIFDYVKELFPEIEDIDVIENKEHNGFVVSINVYGHNILQNDISNGMLKSIYYIVELSTMPNNSLILIDEFENGLGVNCIDILCDLLINDRKDLQFIITSHHPKIIGSIAPDNWKIIDRNSSLIINNTIKELNVDGGHNNAYFNLLNRWEYEGKI